MILSRYTVFITYQIQFIIIQIRCIFMTNTTNIYSFTSNNAHYMNRVSGISFYSCFFLCSFTFEKLILQKARVSEKQPLNFFAQTSRQLSLRNVTYGGLNVSKGFATMALQAWRPFLLYIMQAPPGFRGHGIM